MTEFIKNMLSDSEEVSSKRFLSVSGMIVLVAVMVIHILGVNVPDIIYYTLTGIILGNGTLTLFKNKTK